MITFCNSNVLFIVRNKLAGLEISVISEILAEFFEIDVIGRASFDASGIEHGNVRQSNIFIDKRQILQLPFFVDIKHYLSLYFGQKTGISFKAKIHIFVLMRRFFILIKVVRLVLFDLLSSIDVIFVISELRIGPFDLKIALVVRH